MHYFEQFNDKLTEKDVSNWKLPISSNNFFISQGFGGPYSHFKIRENTDCTHSIDFAVPLNSEVLASKKGIITFILNRGDKAYRGSNMNLALYFPSNQIIIHHGGGIYSLYEHLSKESFSKHNIYEGKEIKQGEIVGETGLSGWIGLLPHLHFNVFVYMKDSKFIERLETIPIKFSDYNESLWDKDLDKEYILNKIITHSCA